MGNPANNLINLNILERKILGINAVVHTSTPWGRQINYQASRRRRGLQPCPERLHQLDTHQQCGHGEEQRDNRKRDAGDPGGHKKPAAGRVDWPIPLKIPEA